MCEFLNTFKQCAEDSSLMGHDSVVIGCVHSDAFRDHSAFGVLGTTRTQQHSVTSQKSQMFSNTAVRTPNPAINVLLVVTGTQASSHIYSVSLLCFQNVSVLFFVH